MLKDLIGVSLRVYFVWTPMLITDNFETACLLEKEFQDEAARHFWDPLKTLGFRFASQLGLKSPVAWDIYLVYKPNAKSRKFNLYRPSFWMHQLNVEAPALWMNPAKLPAKLYEKIIG